MIGLRKYTLRSPTLVIALASVVCFVMIITAYVYSTPTKTGSDKCNFYSSEGCRTRDLFPNDFSRELTDQEIESRVVVKDLLNFVPPQTNTPKVAFLFMTPGTLPFEKLWHLFFQVRHSVLFSLFFSNAIFYFCSVFYFILFFYCIISHIFSHLSCCIVKKVLQLTNIV